jgi:hypothetical protein
MLTLPNILLMMYQLAKMTVITTERSVWRPFVTKFEVITTKIYLKKIGGLDLDSA